MQAKHSKSSRSLFTCNDLGKVNAATTLLGQPRAADDGTIYLPLDDYNFAEPLLSEMNSSTSALGKLCVTEQRSNSALQSDDNNLFLDIYMDAERLYGRRDWSNCASSWNL